MRIKTLSSGVFFGLALAALIYAYAAGVGAWQVVEAATPAPLGIADTPLMPHGAAARALSVAGTPEILMFDVDLNAGAETALLAWNVMGATALDLVLTSETGATTVVAADLPLSGTYELPLDSSASSLHLRAKSDDGEAVLSRTRTLR